MAWELVIEEKRSKLNGDERFSKEPLSLWRLVVASLYDTNDHGWDVAVKKIGSGHSPWFCINKHWLAAEKFSRFNVRNGRKVPFWHHLWFGSSLLKDQFPSIFSLSLSPLMTVFEAWDRNSSSRSLKDDEIDDFVADLDCLSSFTPCEVEDDRRWKLDSSRLFSVSSLCKFVAIPPTLPKDCNAIFWNSRSPKKVSFLS